MKNFVRPLGIIVFVASMVACSAPSTAPAPNVSEPVGEQKTAQKPERMIRRLELGENWPFTVDSGMLSCVQYELNNGASKENKRRLEKNMHGILFSTDGKTYAVNGMASGRANQYGYRDLKEVWAVDTALTNSMVRAGVPYEKAVLLKDMGPVTEIGLSLCR